MQRKLALQVPLTAGDFGAVQTSGDTHFDSLATKTQGAIHRFAHSAAKGHPLFQLQSDRFSHQLRVQLRFVNFVDIDENFALGFLGQIGFELFDLGTFASDDDAGAGGADGDAQLVAGTIHFNRTHAGRLQPLMQRFFQVEIFFQKLGVVLFGEPA